MARTPTPDTIDRERQVLELRRAGATFDDIAVRLGFANKSGAWQAYKRALDRTLVDAGADELRAIEADRLDRLQQRVWVLALGGDLPAVNVMLRIMERRARLLGLDAPVKQELRVEQVDPTSIDAEVQRLVSLLERNDAPA
jgi:hypothetical protein